MLFARRINRPFFFSERHPYLNPFDVLNERTLNHETEWIKLFSNALKRSCDNSSTDSQHSSLHLTLLSWSSDSIRVHIHQRTNSQCDHWTSFWQYFSATCLSLPQHVAMPLPTDLHSTRPFRPNYACHPSSLFEWLHLTAVDRFHFRSW